MGLPLPKESGDFEVVQTAFRRSLNGLEIEPARFRAVPLRQRKLALYDAIYRTARHLACDLKWYEDRSELTSKKLWDFTPDQIAQHKAVLDALIAFVCLGETSFIRPLVTYLSFPEPRWSILIDSVLRALSTKGVRGTLFRIPSADDKSYWRKWVLQNLDSTKMRDYGDLLLSGIGFEDIERLHFQAPLGESVESSLVNRNEFFDSSWKYFDERQADFCWTALYPELKSYQFERFAESIDGFARDNPKEGNFNTLVACTNDWISELRLPKSKLKDNWFAFSRTRPLNARTDAIMFQILVHPRKDRKLSRSFSKQLLGDDANVYLIGVLGDILEQSQNPDAIYRIAKAYSEYDSFSIHTKQVLADLSPMASITIHLWVNNLFSREIENFCILGGERPEKRLDLISYVSTTLLYHDRHLLRFARFQNSSNPIFRHFAERIDRFYESRQALVKEFFQEPSSIARIITGYLHLIGRSFERLKVLLTQ